MGIQMRRNLRHNEHIGTDRHFLYHSKGQQYSFTLGTKVLRGITMSEPLTALDSKPEPTACIRVSISLCRKKFFRIIPKISPVHIEGPHLDVGAEESTLSYILYLATFRVYPATFTLYQATFGVYLATLSFTWTLFKDHVIIVTRKP